MDVCASVKRGFFAFGSTAMTLGPGHIVKLSQNSVSKTFLLLRHSQDVGKLFAKQKQLAIVSNNHTQIIFKFLETKQPIMECILFKGSGHYLTIGNYSK